MSYSHNPYGAQINLKMNSQSANYHGPSQLGYGNPNPPADYTFNKVSQKLGNFLFPQKQQSSVIFQNVSIISKKAQKVLDVCQDKQKPGMLIIYEDFKQPNQRFDILKLGDYVNIVSKKTGKFLTVGGNSEKNGAPIFQEPAQGLVGQKFRLAQLENPNEYLIHTFCGKVLDCCEEKTSNGTSVIQWKCDRELHQVWLIK